jgi:hypothetical protein
MDSWGVWDRVNERWVAGPTMTQSEASYLASRWNVGYGTIYYCARRG